MKKILLSLTLLFVTASSFAEYGGFLWNTENSPYNNGYNFALGVQNDDFQQPGEASGQQPDISTCEDAPGRLGLLSATINDGLRAVDSIYDCNYDEQVVALAVGWDGGQRDFQFYRLEGNGTWTYKPGYDRATNKDASGKVITDLINSDRGIYTDFCSFLCVDYDKLLVK